MCSTLTADNPPKTPARLRERAAHYRQLSFAVTDAQMLIAIRQLADEYEDMARGLEIEER